MAKLLVRSVQAICVGGLALGMSAAMAQETTVVQQHVGIDRERLVVANYSDPETEIGNGTYPPRREANSETEADTNVDVPMEADNYPETEIGNGTFLPKVNPMAQDKSVVPQQVEAVDGEHLIVVAYSDSDPESEVNNGTKPGRVANDPESEIGNDIDGSMETDNFPETEVGNGTYPPGVNP